jgi:hypothetical protein
MSKSNSTAPLDSAKTNRDVQPHTPGAAKPAKPYPDFPVTPHPAGYWCKKTGADRAATRGRRSSLRPNSLRCVGQNAQRSDRETSCSSPHGIRGSQQSNNSFGRLDRIACKSKNVGWPSSSSIQHQTALVRMRWAPPWRSCDASPLMLYPLPMHRGRGGERP